MWKKVLVASLLISLLVILAAGVAIRTLDRTGNLNTTTQTWGGGRNATDTSAPATNGQGGNGAAQGQSPAWGQNTQALNWIVVQGTVTSVDQITLNIQTADGKSIIIENRPWTFALEQKFAAQVGDKISVTGYYYGEIFEAGKIENLTNGKIVQLRDQYGRPGWSAGRGRSGG